MASGYDEWAAARTPSLLRLALVLAGADHAADAMVRTALARVWSSWESIDDPDLRARRLVVDACPSRRPTTVRTHVPVAAGGPPGDLTHDAIGPWLDALPSRRRAAVILRHLEDRTDAEIAEILGSSVSTVRNDLARAALPTDRTDFQLREALATAAAAAPTQLSRATAQVDAPPSRRGRSASLAALAVVGLVVGVAVVNHATKAQSGVIHYPAVTVPSVWRAESYDGVQVRVPNTWGWGGAPVHSDIFGGHQLGSCGANEAAVLSENDGSTYVTSATPFTGRPAVLSDRCVSWGSDGAMPNTDAVWFDSPIAVGVKPLGAVVAETRAVGSQHVTVFSGDPTLRREILGTAQEVDVDANGCPTQAVQRPSRSADSLAPSSVSVCVYSQDTGTSVLLWSARRDGAAGLAYTQAFAAAATSHSAGATCPATPQGEWVALGVRDAHGAAERWDILDLGCGRLLGAGTEARPTVADVSPWAGGGTTAYVTVPHGADAGVAAYFQGALR